MQNTATYNVKCPCPLDDGNKMYADTPGIRERDRAREREIFMDSNFLEDSTMPDSDRWSNHPGFIGGTWWKDFWAPKKAEKERHDKEQGKVNKANPFSESDSCDSLDEKIEKLDSQINKISVGGGKERVQNRQLKTREKRRLDIKDMWNKKDCSQQLIDEQAAEFDAKVAKLFGEAQSRVDARSKEDGNLQNVAIGVGILLVGGVFSFSVKKKKRIMDEKAMISNFAVFILQNKQKVINLINKLGLESLPYDASISEVNRVVIYNIQDKRLEKGLESLAENDYVGIVCAGICIAIVAAIIVVGAGVGISTTVSSARKQRQELIAEQRRATYLSEEERDQIALIERRKFQNMFLEAQSEYLNKEEAVYDEKIERKKQNIAMILSGGVVTMIAATYMLR